MWFYRYHGNPYSLFAVNLDYPGEKKVTRAGGCREKSRESSTQNETWVEGLARLLPCGSLFSPYMESLLAG